MVFSDNVNLHPLGITLPVPMDVDWELRHTFLQILSKFSDMPGEDPKRHLQDFEMTCYTIRTQGTMGELLTARRSSRMAIHIARGDSHNLGTDVTKFP